MPANAFEQVIENCTVFAKRKKEAGGNVSFGLGFLTSKETIPELEDFVILCKKLGADFSQFRPFTGDLTDISKQYVELKNRYETNTFFVRASLQKYREMGKEQKRHYM
jgi:hypothetical protein